mmetsp:Transcript_11880/g.17010  ORF Transcript_11880/g.17010 Transcript_11880/m.17010 type:complete len:203 (+) Transcript_11880:100-708(+)
MNTVDKLTSPESLLSISSFTLPAIEPSTTALGAWLKLGEELGLPLGATDKLGEELGRSSQNLPLVLSLLVTSTAIMFGSPPSESDTSTKPSGVVSFMLYVPGAIFSNTNSPVALLRVVATVEPLASTNSTTAPEIGLSQIPSLSPSSSTIPLILRPFSSQKSLPVEFCTVVRPRIVTLILFRSSPSKSLTSTNPCGFTSITL